MFHNKTQIKNFRYIYLADDLPDDALIVRNKYIEVFYLCFIVKHLPSIFREKYLQCVTFHYHPT